MPGHVSISSTLREKKAIKPCRQGLQTLAAPKIEILDVGEELKCQLLFFCEDLHPVVKLKA